MQVRSVALVVVALAAFFGHGDAQARCPELDRLRSEAAKAVTGLTGVATSARCDAYNRFSITWGEIVGYASAHRESCDISSASLAEFEKRHREVTTRRDAVCTNRPVQPFPPDVVRQ